MESAADWPPPITRVPRKPKVAQFCAAPWPNFTPPLTTLLLTAFLVLLCGFPPVATVPFGVISFGVAMWMLSGSTSASGLPDMLPAILLRGLAMSFLFLSIILISLTDLKGLAIAHGVSLFNIGRQTGGMIGVAFMGTFIDHQNALNSSTLGSKITAGRIGVSEHLEALSHMFMSQGMDAGSASHAALAMLGREVMKQAHVISFDTAFVAIVIFFLAAAPVMILTKAVISKLITEVER